MKKSFLLLLLFITISAIAQQQSSVNIPQITVSGEGKVTVKPDYVVITLGVENTGKEAAEVKKLNDETVDKVLKYIKNFGIPVSDYQTTNVGLNKNYNYEKKVYSFVASQSLSITLKDVAKYDALMMGLVNLGINDINQVVFKSTKIEELKATARREAIKSAKRKADDYVFPLGQKVGKALLITENNNSETPIPLQFKASGFVSMAPNEAPQQTLAIGEIEVIATVSVSFILE